MLYVYCCFQGKPPLDFVMQKSLENLWTTCCGTCLLAIIFCTVIPISAQINWKDTSWTVLELQGIRNLCIFQILKMFLFFSCRKYINWFNLILVSYLSSNAAFHFKYKRWNTGTQTIKEAIFFYHATQHATHPEYVIVLLLLLVRVFADPCSCNTFKVLGC